MLCEQSWPSKQRCLFLRCKINTAASHLACGCPLPLDSCQFQLSIQAEIACLPPGGCRHDFCCAHVLSAMQEAKDVGDEFLALEKFVNLNYMVRIISALVIM